MRFISGFLIRIRFLIAAGVNTIKKGELLAARIPSIKKEGKIPGIDSLEYTTVHELAEAIGLPLETLCIDCDLPAQAAFV